MNALSGKPEKIGPEEARKLLEASGREEESRKVDEYEELGDEFSVYLDLSRGTYTLVREREYDGVFIRNGKIENEVVKDEEVPEEYLERWKNEPGR